MNRRLFVVVSLAGLALCGCGSSNRLLTAIAVSPVTAHASGSVGVQFTAAGTFNASPMTVTPLSVNWSFTGFTTAPASTQIPEPPLVSIDSNGLAHCNGFKGSVPIVAIHPVNPAAPPPDAPPIGTGVGFVAGGASLTCD